MSLDVYLYSGERYKCCPHCGHRIDEGGLEDRRERVYDANITHNLGEMADAAGIYDVVWRPEEHGITKAGQLIDPLEKALEWMNREPEYFKKYDAPNGWGLYVHFVPWLQRYLDACRANPEADVEVSR